MWSPDRRRAAFALIALACAPFLAACSFTPLYGSSSAASGQLNLTYGEPDSRLDQIIYQDLALRLGTSNAPDAALVTIAATQSSRRVGRTASGSPATTHEMTVTASMTVTAPADGDEEPEVIYATTRKAIANYTTNGQRLADQQAGIEAAERAAGVVAQTLRLALSAALAARQ